ncbi:MAG: LPS export ABC transporter permease LptF, partial [Wenzhouxiangella sp.]
MLILQRYILRQGLSASLLSLAVFLSVTVALFLAELVGDAAQGELPGSSVMALLALRMPEAAMLVGPLALLTGLLLAFGRLQEDSETVVVRAAGLHYRQVLAPVVLLSLLWAGAMTAVAGWGLPAAAGKTASLMADAARHAMVAGVRPGQFGRLDNGRMTVYVGGVDRGSEVLQNVFIQHMEGRVAEVLTAREGRVWADPADQYRYLTLTDGHQLQHAIPPTGDGVREMRFMQNEMRLPNPDVSRAPEETVYRLPELVQPETPVERREWHWRLAAPVAALLLGVLAVPLSARMPRQGRFGNIVVALVLYLIYSNAVHAGLIVMEQRAAMSGPGLWPVHGALAL